MISFISILINTKETYRYLYDLYEEKLESNCFWIFVLLGTLSGINSLIREIDHLKTTGSAWLIGGFAFLAGVGLSVLLGKYVLPYIIFGIGKQLKSKATLIDNRVVTAYSFIPIIIQISVAMLIPESVGENSLWFKIMEIITSIWSLKILYQGVKMYGKINSKKAMLIISPVLVFNIGSYILVQFST